MMIEQRNPSKSIQKILTITKIQKDYEENGKVRVAFHLDNGTAQNVLWYQFEREYDQYICDDRCDAAITVLFLPAMKAGYHVIRSDYPMSEKLYYNLQYQVIPQLHLAGGDTATRIAIEVPTTKESYHGSLVATGMSRGVDSFATMYEYCKNFELPDYRINAFTYFQTGAHHGVDKTVTGTETRQELYENQMEKTREFCAKYGYPLIVAETNINQILSRTNGMFSEWSFPKTHTLRNLSIPMLLQKGISRYYYSAAYTLDQFKLSLNIDSAYYEKWLIPHLSTESIEFHQSNQDWTRMEKVERIAQLEECYDYLQVCLVKSGNCGSCMKCKRTLIELDALGDEVLEKFKKSFDIDTYRREHRRKWFDEIVYAKDEKSSEAHYFDEAFVCATEHHPELIGDLIKEKADHIKSVKVTGASVNIRELPSLRSKRLFVADNAAQFAYRGEYGAWVGIETDQGPAFVVKKLVELCEE